MTELRAARPGDLAAMHTIETAVFPTTAWSVDQLTDELARHGDSRWYVVATQDDAVVGYAGLYLSAPDADVQTVAVAAGRQGQGIGRALLGALVEHAWSQECTRLFLEVRADNDPALHLYARAGFVRMGRRSRYYADGADAVTMRLRRHEPAPLGEVAHG